MKRFWKRLVSAVLLLATLTACNLAQYSATSLVYKYEVDLPSGEYVNIDAHYCSVDVVSNIATSPVFIGTCFMVEDGVYERVVWQGAVLDIKEVGVGK